VQSLPRLGADRGDRALSRTDGGEVRGAGGAAVSEDVPAYGQVNPLSPDPPIRVELLNLHDAYMNANLIWVSMHNAPIEAANPQTFLISNRARFERLWWALVAVYLESWNSARMRPVREYVASVVDMSILNDMIKSTRRQPLRARLRDVRGYMFHRDARDYHDAGRFAVLEFLPSMNEIHIAFGKMMIEAMSR
jgi:hypothetical protein